MQEANQPELSNWLTHIDQQSLIGMQSLDLNADMLPKLSSLLKCGSSQLRLSTSLQLADLLPSHSKAMLADSQTASPEREAAPRAQAVQHTDAAQCALMTQVAAESAVSSAGVLQLVLDCSTALPQMTPGVTSDHTAEAAVYEASDRPGQQDARATHLLPTGLLTDAAMALGR